MLPCLLLLQIALASALVPSFAKDVALALSINGDYNEQVDRLAEGDVVTFANGQKFKLGPKLGQGNSTVVFALDQKHVLRIPSQWLAGGFTDATYEGAAELAAYGVPIVRVATAPPRSAHHSREYVVAERIQERFSFQQYLYASGPAAALSPTDEKAARDAFLEFARQTALFKQIGDFKPDQVIYTAEGRWMLADWSRHHELVDLPKAGKKKKFLAEANVFSLMLKKAPGDLSRKARDQARLGAWNDSDIGWEYGALNDRPRWLAIKDEIQDAITDERRRFFKRHDGNLKTGAKETRARNLAAYPRLDFGPRAPQDCMASVLREITARRN